MNRLRTALIAIILFASASASAEWSVNLGYASEYYYRGIFQKSSSASGGVDYSNGGFYAGLWTADVGDGLEVDGYLGYGGEVGEFTYGVGFTGYYYTSKFDDTYEEINLSGGYGFVTADVALGQYKNFDGETQHYTYYALTAEHNGFYGKFAGFSQDFTGQYVELGYGMTVSEIDLGVHLLFNDEDLSGLDGGDEAIVFTLGKTFDLN